MQEVKGGDPTTGKPITIKDEEIEQQGKFHLIDIIHKKEKAASKK